jgi:type VI protein secretion system component Hcp
MAGQSPPGRSSIVSGFATGRSTAPRERRRARLVLEELEQRVVLSAGSATLQLIPAAATGQPGAPSPLTIALDSYQFGFTSPGTNGKATFDALAVQAPLSGNAPLLFQALTAGSAYPRAVLTQTDDTGQAVAAFVLGTVVVTSDQVGRDTSGPPGEALQLGFGAITEATGAQASSWSAVTNSRTSADIPALPDGTSLAALPAPPATGVTLELDSAPGGPGPVTIPLSSYQFGLQNGITEESLGRSGNGVGATHFADLAVTAPWGADSLLVFARLVDGSSFSTATLIQNNAAGAPVAGWVLARVNVTQDQIQASAGSLPGETVHLAFEAITAATSRQTASFDQLTAKSTGPGIPSLPPGTSLAELPTPADSGLALELQLGTGSAAPAPVTVTVDSYQFGRQNPATLGTSGTGIASGKTSIDGLFVTASYGADSPALWQVLTSGTSLPTAVLTQKNAAGQTVAEWLLQGVFISEDDVSASAPMLPGESLRLVFGTITESTSSRATFLDERQGAPNASPAVPPLAGLMPSAAPPASDMTLDLEPGSGSAPEPLTIPLDSYQFGIASPIASGQSGGGTSKVSFDDLIVTAPFGPDAPAVFESLILGGRYQTAVLSQENAAGEIVAEWVLGTVVITQDDLSGAAGGQPPVETLHLVFGAVTEATGSSSGANEVASWNQLTSTDMSTSASFGAIPPPPDVLLSPLPAPQPTADVTLEFTPAPGASFPAVTIALDTYQFGFQDVTSASTSEGKTSFDELEVTTRFWDLSPVLLQALVTGSRFPTVVLRQESPGNAGGTGTVAEWVLGTASITHLAVASNSSDTPGQTLSLYFGSITEATSGQTASWSQLQGNSDAGNVPALPAGSSLVPLPDQPATALTLELSPGPQPAASTLVTLSLDSYQFGFHGAASIGAGGAVRGAISFDALTVTAPFAVSSPLLLSALTSGASYTSAVLTLKNAAGQPVGAWIVGKVFVSMDALDGQDNALGAQPPGETIQLTFGSITEATSTHVASWNVLTETASGAPALPPDLTLAPITPAVVTISGGPFRFDGTAHPASATATGVGGVAVPGTFTFAYSLNGNPAEPIHAGTYQVVATFTSSDPDYAGATATGTIVIDKAGQSIAFDSVPEKTFGAVDFSLSARASTGLPVAFTTTGAVSIAGNIVHILGAGGVTIVAHQAGNNDFEAAPDVSQSFTIDPAATSVMLSSSLDPSPSGRALTFTATVRASSITPAGHVTFFDGTTALGTADLDADGRASLTLPAGALSIGDHSITVRYSGTQNHLASTSPALVQHVLSAQQQTAALIGQVGALVGSKALKRADGRTLTTKLNDALHGLDKGKTQTGVSKLTAFLKQVNAFKKQRKLTSAQAQLLIDAANQAIASAGT